MSSKPNTFSLTRLVFAGLGLFTLGGLGMAFAPLFAGPAFVLTVILLTGYQIYQLNKAEQQERKVTAMRYPLMPLEKMPQHRVESN